MQAPGEYFVGDRPERVLIFSLDSTAAFLTLSRTDLSSSTEVVETNTRELLNNW